MLHPHKSLSLELFSYSLYSFIFGRISLSSLFLSLFRRSISFIIMRGFVTRKL